MIQFGRLVLVEDGSEESERNRRHWRSEIDRFQFQLNSRLTTNLKKHLSDRLDFIYGKVRKNAISKTGLLNRFSEQIPYSLSQILGEEYDYIDKVGDRIDRVAAVVEQQAKTTPSLVEIVQKLLDR